MSRMARDRMSTPEMREQSAANLRRLWNQPGFAEKHRERVRALHRDPAFAAAWAAGSRARM
ncbi:hypothetical protein, partial [uncultured Brevundimonas sp.]|uniref:hypothetical protein n=1 Tax=uncultured Brevundimonas sp. TaxID=213418 RepID=UPI0025EFF865